MHISPLLEGSRRPRPVLVAVLAATGFRHAAWFAGAAAATALVARDASVERVGPLQLQPPVPVLMLVPALLAIGCALAHQALPCGVLTRSRRTTAAVSGSYAVFLAAAVAVVCLSAAWARVDVRDGSLRNLGWMVGLALGTSALAGVRLAWLPLVCALGFAMLSTPGSTLATFVFAPTTTPWQVGIAGGLLAAGLALALWDPRHLSYPRAFAATRKSAV
ncbi:hypothetical protein Celgi_0593 [Cellulomonas gilvus ATCC 13127]|uniref:Uncharacterized protein n=2 Tax=Cellulomonas gilvus TaxID=11 RepID=F8A6Q3_CELGA|nr:hypothetical protein Celgi_0593 [Cellulomonas gilvus ATCC 13127]